MQPDRPKPKLAPIAASALVLTAVGGIGLWARGAPADVPLKIEPAPAPVAETVAPAPISAAPRRYMVHVAGEVFRPGVYALGPGDRVADAIRQAGGALPTAAPERLNLAEPLRDGQKITVPSGNAPVASPVAPTRPGVAPPETDLSSEPGMNPVSPETAPPAIEESEPASPKPTSLAPASISLNAATLADLDRLPGIGPATAEKILAERERRGGFQAIDDLLDVRGIGPAKLAKIRPYLTL